ncbi:MAG TPA: hypothetical protein VME46_05945 [Acidimicrobiales bacterium]|nr:hypothetical protein [Acidimicrobiales bacterium]
MSIAELAAVVALAIALTAPTSRAGPLAVGIPSINHRTIKRKTRYQ